MSDEKEIAAIAKTLAKAGLLSETYNKSVARVLVAAGYRKADEVRKETIKDLLPRIENDILLYAKLSGFGERALQKIMDLFEYEQKEIFKEYGVEVEE